MARFAALKKHLKASPLPGEVQDAVISKAKEHFRKHGGSEEDASKVAVQHFHDIVDEDMKGARDALHGRRAKS